MVSVFSNTTSNQANIGLDNKSRDNIIKAYFKVITLIKHRLMIKNNTFSREKINLTKIYFFYESSKLREY